MVTKVYGPNSTDDTTRIYISGVNDTLLTSSTGNDTSVDGDPSTSVSDGDNTDTVLEWLYEGDGTDPRLAEDATDAFICASSRWYENSSGVLVSAAANAAVFEYSAGTYLGYRQEPQRQNKVTAYNVIGVDQDGSELVTNGGFDADNNWNKGVNWTIAGGVLVAANVGNGTSTDQINVYTLGKIYRVSFDLVGTSGSVGVSAGFNLGIARSSTGSYTEDLVCTGDRTLRIRATGGSFTGTVDNVSVIEIGGTKLNSNGTSEGTFVGGYGVGAKIYRAGGAWVNDALDGIDGSGGTNDESYVELVADIAKVAASKWANMNASGSVFKAVAGASAGMNIDITGALSAADHTLFTIARGDSAADDDIELRTDNVDGSGVQNLTDSYVLYEETLTALANDKMRIQIAAGDTVYFFLVKAEAGSARTSEIITQGAAVTKAIDDQQLPVAAGTNHRDAQGELSFKVTFGYNAADVSTDQGLVTWNDNATDGISYDGTNLTISDGTNTATVALAVVAGTEYEVKARWDTTTSKMQIKVDSTVGSEGTFDGAMNIGTNYRLGYGDDERIWLKDIVSKRVDPGVYV
jgi:hypothetical protein